MLVPGQWAVRFRAARLSLSVVALSAPVFAQAPNPKGPPPAAVAPAPAPVAAPAPAAPAPAAPAPAAPAPRSTRGSASPRARRLQQQRQSPAPELPPTAAEPPPASDRRAASCNRRTASARRERAGRTEMVRLVRLARVRGLVLQFELQRAQAAIERQRRDPRVRYFERVFSGLGWLRHLAPGRADRRHGLAALRSERPALQLELRRQVRRRLRLAERQASVRLVSPGGKGSPITLDFGKFDTIYGAEVAESQDNINYTRGVLYWFGQPAIPHRPARELGSHEQPDARAPWS